jgi:hypothetical protein
LVNDKTPGHLTDPQANNAAQLLIPFEIQDEIKFFPEGGK